MNLPATRQCAPTGVWVYVAIAAWGIGVVAMLGRLAAYSYTPGSLATPPLLKDVSVPIARSETTYRLVMTIHPKCPCSRASLGELARLLARFPDELQCTVLVFQAHGVDDQWAHTNLVRSARQQPNTQVILDADGRFARQLGMSTSGSVILYSPAGAPEYWGGITAARGHHGDNVGSDAVRAIVSGRHPARRTAPVFGCQIDEDADAIRG